MKLNKKIIGLAVISMMFLGGFVFANVDGCKIGAGNLAKIKAATGVTCEINAQNICPYTKDSCGICCIMNTVFNVTTWVFVLLMAISTLMIIWGAVLFTTSSGEPEKTQKARQLIIYAAVGIVIALLAQAVPLLVKFIVVGA